MPPGCDRFHEMVYLKNSKGQQNTALHHRMRLSPLNVTYPAFMSKRIKNSAAIAGGGSEESTVKPVLLGIDALVLDAMASRDVV